MTVTLDGCQYTIGWQPGWLANRVTGILVDWHDCRGEPTWLAALWFRTTGNLGARAKETNTGGILRSEHECIWQPARVCNLATSPIRVTMFYTSIRIFNVM